MSLPTRCPLGHERVAFIEHIKTRELTSAYQSSFAIDISEMLGHRATISFCECTDCGIKFFYPPTPGPPQLYAELSNISWYYIAGKEEYRLAARRVQKGQRILEVGCGSGAFARYLAEPDYIGLEYNSDAIKSARATGLDVRPQSIEDFANNHPNEFDVVCSFQVLEHVADPSSFISACVTCAKPRGLVIFGVPNCGSYLGVQPDDLLNMPPHHLTWWTETVFWRLAPQFDLDVVATESEPLTNSNAYADTRAMRLLMKRFSGKRTLLFDGPKYHIMKAAAKVLRGFMLAGLYDGHLTPPGHSILAILRKR